jgi:1-deoxy-D-xylulose-5-phosphate reductoisomerase
MHSPHPSAAVRTQPSKSKSRRTRVAILGATGSIGTNAIDVCCHLSDRFEINSLTAVTSWKKLAEQALEVRPKKVALNDKSTHDHPSENLRALKDAILGTGIELVTGPHAMEEIARSDDVDTVVAAVVGAAGLAPVIAAAAAGKTIALANKEALVVAGSIVMPTAHKHGSTIIPVDSEHSAIFQSLRSGTSAEIRKIILTASGGPFRTWTKSKIEHATVEQALAHPNWKMGPKITIDSATMMNKALEIIEAHWLFHLPAEKIEVLIHPQSIVHSMIEFMDGSVIAQLGTPDMRTPIQYALTHPERFDGCSTRLDWSKIKEMTFEQPDERFPALQLGYEVIRLGGTSGAVVNAANEIANEMFRAGKLRFGQIVEKVQEVLQRHKKSGFIADPTLEQLLAADHWARSESRL